MCHIVETGKLKETIKIWDFIKTSLFHNDEEIVKSFLCILNSNTKPSF